MEIALSSHDRTITATVRGMATEPDGPEIKQCFNQIVESPQRTVLLDFSHVPMMTSAGIGKLIMLHKNLKAQKRDLKINAIYKDLYAMFSSINLDKMITLNR